MAKEHYSPATQWMVIRLSTGEPLFPEPVGDRHAAEVQARARIVMDMLRDPKTDEVHYTMRKPAQVTAILARDYRFVEYELKEIKKR